MPHLSTMKPSFLNELCLAEPKEMAPITDKVKGLAKDPSPDGSAKKKLKYLDGRLDRLRAGHLRVIYAADKTRVSLLALRRREKGRYDEDFESVFLGGLDLELPQVVRHPGMGGARATEASGNEAAGADHRVAAEASAGARRPLQAPPVADHGRAALRLLRRRGRREGPHPSGNRRDADRPGAPAAGPRGSRRLGPHPAPGREPPRHSPETRPGEGVLSGFPIHAPSSAIRTRINDRNRPHVSARNHAALCRPSSGSRASTAGSRRV